MTKELYYLIHRIKSDDPEAVEQIIQCFEPKIKKSSQFVHPNNREDLEQELKIQMIKAIKHFESRQTPGFWEFVNNSNSYL